jgi:hypothetical protein
VRVAGRVGLVGPKLIKVVVAAGSGQQVLGGEVTCSSSSSLVSNPGSWMSSITNISSGSCTITFATNTWETYPHCVMINSNSSSTTMISYKVYSVSTTAFSFRGRTDAPGDITSQAAMLICVGEKYVP